MNNKRSFLLLGSLIFGALAIDQAMAQRPDGRPVLDIDRSVTEMLREEAVSPTNSANVVSRYQKLVNLVRAMIRNNVPVKEILPPQEGERIEMLIRRGDLDQAAPAVAEAIRKLGGKKQAENIPSKDVIREQQPYREAASRQAGITPGSGLDADNFLWGTEVFPDYRTIASELLKETLPIRYLKIRLQINSFSTKDGKTFSSDVCKPSPANCVVRFNMDELADTFREHGWSMIPMISNVRGKPVTAQDIDDYVNFVDWFVSRYKTGANIKYVELIDAPFLWWKGTVEQLAELNNRTYERIKGKHPEILVGTPGFEYFVDTTHDDKSVQEIEYFLDRRNNLKFDFWAFHGYPTIDMNSFAGSKIAHPPTKKAEENKYAGPAGILEIRKKLDSNGWTDRLIIDSEHINAVSKPTPFISEEEDTLNAAYTVQELLIKRTLTISGRPALNGIVPLKIAPRGSRGDFIVASMRPDGAPTMTVRAVGHLVSKLKEFKHSSHMSGEFDNESQAWLEKFQSKNKELYIFFKPFAYRKGWKIAFDGQVANYTLSLSRKPASIVLTDVNGSVKYLAPNRTIVLEAVNSPRFLAVSYE